VEFKWKREVNVTEQLVERIDKWLLFSLGFNRPSTQIFFVMDWHTVRWRKLLLK
jgi:hypothetical protein